MVNTGAIKARLKELTGHFTKEYVKAYKTALILDIRRRVNNKGGDDSQQSDAMPEWQLMLQDTSNLLKHPQIEGVVYVGDGLKKKVHWSMGKNFVVTEKPVEEEKEEKKDGGVAPAEGAEGAAAAASSSSGDEKKEVDMRVWLDNACTKVCMNPACGVQFGLLKRRSHCRHCGEIFCKNCTKFTIGKEKFCENCHKMRSEAADPSTLPPLLERPKVKIQMRNFHMYKVALHDAELFANAGAADAAAECKLPEGAEGKFLLILSHPRPTRPTLTIAFDKKEDRDAWMSKLQAASGQSPPPVTMDPVLRPAFITAFRNTRWYCWVWGGWEIDGTEGELLSELFYDVMAREIFYSELSAMGDMPRKIARKAIVKMIEGAVSGMWASLQKGLAGLREPIEKAAEEMLGPLFEKEMEIKEKISQPISEAVDKGMEQGESKLQEGFGSAVPVIGAAMEAELNLIKTSLTELIEEVEKEKGSVLGFWWKYDWMQWRNDWMYSYKNKPISEMIDLKLAQSDSSYESRNLAYHLRTDLMALNQSAWYVLKKRLKADCGNDASEDAYIAALKRHYPDIIVRAAHDLQLIISKRLLEALDATLRGPLLEGMDAVLKALLSPLESLIPDLIKDVLDPRRAAGEIIDALLTDKQGKLIEVCTRPVREKIGNKGTALAQEGI